MKKKILLQDLADFLDLREGLGNAKQTTLYVASLK